MKIDNFAWGYFAYSNIKWNVSHDTAAFKVLTFCYNEAGGGGWGKEGGSGGVRGKV